MGRHGPQPQRRVTRSRVAELAQRGRRVATWTGTAIEEKRAGGGEGSFHTCEVLLGFLGLSDPPTTRRAATSRVVCA